MKKYSIHTDGGSRGNPGQAAIGVVIDEMNENGKVTYRQSYGERIGIATNNVAEYKAVISALKRLIEMNTSVKKGVHRYEFFLDSLLVVSQLNGVYRVKDANLRELVYVVRDLEQQLGGTVFYAAVLREFNKDADLEVNAALDRA